MNKKNKVNELNMDFQTYKKISGTLNPQDKKNVTITTDKPSPTSSSTSSTTMEEDAAPTAAIAPKDKATIKYLSNVKDATTGEVSKPFTIANKRYQMVRGINPSKEVVMGVYCHDDINESGDNIIHSMEYFEENIANPMKEQMEMVGQDIAVAPKKESFDYAGEERKFHDRESFMDYLNLSDLEGYKLFFVNTKTGEVTGKFKNIQDMVTSGIHLGNNEKYMDAKALKRFRIGDYFKGGVNEVDGAGSAAPDGQQAPADTGKPDSGTNIPKLQADVAKLVDQIKKRFSVYLSKLDKPIEQAEFLTTMAKEIGVPINKLSTIITQFRDLATDTNVLPPASFASESKILTKKELEETIQAKKVIKTIKIKDIK